MKFWVGFNCSTKAFLNWLSLSYQINHNIDLTSTASQNDSAG